MGKVPRNIIELQSYLIVQPREIVNIVREMKLPLREKFFAPHNIADLPQHWGNYHTKCRI